MYFVFINMDVFTSFLVWSDTLLKDTYATEDKGKYSLVYFGFLNVSKKNVL